MKQKHQEKGAPSESIPSSLLDLLRTFEPCFTAPTFETFVALVSGWILCRGRRWITRVLVASGFLRWKHDASFHRFFSSARWETDDVGRKIFELMLERLPETIEVAVDDTLCRRSGPRIFGISMQRDGSTSSYGAGGGNAHTAFACGHSWVVVTVRFPLPWSRRGCAIPVLARLYQSPKRCSKAAYRKRTELAREMIEALLSWLPEGRKLHVTGDREYACKTLLRGLDASIDFTGPLPMDAQLFEEPPAKYSGMGRPRVRGARIASPEKRATNSNHGWAKLTLALYGGMTTKLLVQTWTCLWYTATGPRVVRVVLTRDPKGNYSDRAFFATDIRSSPTEILQRFAARWLIEVCFRDAKQIFGLVDPQNGFSRGRKEKTKPRGPKPRGKRGRHAVERTAPFAWAVYSIVVIWYVRSDRWRGDVAAHRHHAPWYRQKRTPSVEDMLSAARIEIQAYRLSRQARSQRTLEESRDLLRDIGMAA